ncbi:hypothetical protein, partial [Bacillus thuringiensis]
KRRFEALIREQYNNINLYTDTVPNTSVLINGDMTSFGHDDLFNPEWSKIKDFFRTLRRSYYYRLGNHNIENNFDDFVNNGCFKSSLVNLIYHVQGRGIPSSQFDYRTESGGYYLGFAVT